MVEIFVKNKTNKQKKINVMTVGIPVPFPLLKVILLSSFRPRDKLQAKKDLSLERERKQQVVALYRAPGSCGLVCTELPARLVAGFLAPQHEVQLCETCLLGTEPPAWQNVPVKSQVPFGRVTGVMWYENEILLLLFYWGEGVFPWLTY